MGDISQQRQERAARLLALAVKAREEGYIDRAESFAAMAATCLDQVITLEREQIRNLPEDQCLI